LINKVKIGGNEIFVRRKNVQTFKVGLHYNRSDIGLADESVV